MHYPIEWWSAVLTNASKADLKYYWQFASDKLLSPDINLSTSEFQIINKDGQDKILAPLNLLDGVGTAAISELTAKRPFTSLDDFITRIDHRKVHKGIVFKLIFSGIMDRFFDQSSPFEIDKYSKYMNTKASLFGDKLDQLPSQILNMTNIQRTLIKKTIFKVFNEDLRSAALPHLVASKMAVPLSTSSETLYLFQDANDKYKPQKLIVNANQYEDLLETDRESSFALIGYVISTKEHKYQNNTKTMLKIQVDVDDKNYELVKFPPYKKDHHGIEIDIEESICAILLDKRAGKNEAFVKDIIVIADTSFLKDKDAKTKTPKKGKKNADN